MQFQVAAIRAVVVSGLLLLGGCSIYSFPGGQTEPVEPEPEEVPITPPSSPPPAEADPDEPDTSGAYRRLIDNANQASERGDYEQALALLERAQRIDPNNGEIYLALAKTYRAKGDFALAADTAERGLLYCKGASVCDALRAYLQ